jgi:hypothetical protein
VKDRESVEEWADALLDQHRTAPRRKRGTGHAERGYLDGAPWMVRLASRLSGQPPDPEMLERARRRAKRHAVFERIDAIVTLVGIVALCVLFYAIFSGVSIH